MTVPAELDQVRERVRARYAQAASTVAAGGVPSCGDTCAGPDEPGTGAGLYSATEQASEGLGGSGTESRTGAVRILAPRSGPRPGSIRNMARIASSIRPFPKTE